MKIPTFVTCVDLPSGEIVRFNEGETIKLAIAVSALIPIFRPIVYENYTLIDGGFMDNLPVEPLLGLSYPVEVSIFSLLKTQPKKQHLLWLRAVLIHLYTRFFEAADRTKRSVH